MEKRPNWQENFESLGFSFHTIGGLYWREGICYEFTPNEIDHLEEVSRELYAMCQEATDYVISGDLRDLRGIPEMGSSNVSIVLGEDQKGTDGVYGKEGFVYQEYFPIPCLYGY